ncbi:MULTISPECIES: CGNR zinc finger domain-containing protein [Streptomyces]|uniref:CGNR zinc finger domain-containing protein n=1 Tax=Streptomyces TaxID=1883 RepID=UPI00207941CC|nr:MULTISPECIES: ABATE domain-containing protein [Streptomyces]MCM9083048.1 ABATE domain-containing protein [Streptomyces spororaveus]WSR13493.1 ABATE domain-containing protein [Streptomyces sp. NBC_01207]
MDSTDPGTSAPLLGEPLPIELMNTIWADRDGVHDAIAGPDGAVAWLRAVGPRLTPSAPAVGAWLDAERPAGAEKAAAGLRGLRDALRRLAAEATEDPRPDAQSAIGTRDAALAALNEACSATPVWATLHWPSDGDPIRIVRTSDLAGQAVVAMLAGQAVDLFTGDMRPQLRACLAPGCVLYFVKQHSRREWCSAGCGNRARVARHYQRHRVTKTDPES